jgi:AcrR family transcriptional regulator
LLPDAPAVETLYDFGFCRMRAAATSATRKKRTFVLSCAAAMIFGNLRRDKVGNAGELRSKGEQTRQAVLARALKIAAREGLAALTIGRLAEELRMSKSGLFAHFHSKQALELATLEKAKEVFADAVLRPAQASRVGIERVWNLCDLWLQHIERRVFSGAYFFTGAFFEYADRPGPIAEAITRVAQEWFNTLRKSVQEAQEQGQINPEAKAKKVAWELNDRLVGAHWANLLEGGGRCREARIALLDRLRELATGKIPASAFESIGAWKEYLQGKH